MQVEGGDDRPAAEQIADRGDQVALGVLVSGGYDKALKAWTVSRAGLEAVGSDWDTPAGRDIIWRSRSSKTSDLLVKILLNKKTKSSCVSALQRDDNCFLDSLSKAECLRITHFRRN